MVVRRAGGARGEAGRRGLRDMRRRRSLQGLRKHGGSTPDWEAVCRWEKAVGHGGAAISCSQPQEPALTPRPHRNLYPDCRRLSSSTVLVAPNTVAAPQSPCCPNPPSSSSRSSSPRSDRKGSLFDAGADQNGPRGKRDKRREQMRMRREELLRTAKMDMLEVNAGVKDVGSLGTPKQARIGAKTKKDILGLGQGNRVGEALGERVVPRKGGEGGSPFPGRQSFLDKVRKFKDGS